MTNQEIVVAAGGIYVGRMQFATTDLVMFTAPQTGSTLAIKADRISVAAVRSHIDEHVANWVKKGGQLRALDVLKRWALEDEIEQVRRSR